MARDTLTGSRIRERRIMAGLRQAELARQAGISASYLNLIEHNRRRIGGKLLLDIAAVLDVEPALLTEGAEATLIASLREAASDERNQGAEIDRVDEFAGRFPGWAGLLSASRGRIATLERTVQTLTDRLTHDPHLAASLHEMLTTVTSIRSTAAILADGSEIEREWQDRFHRNINEDSARLAEISRALAQYLDTADDASSEIGAPQDEIDHFLATHGHRFDELEQGGDAQSLVGQSDLSPVAARMLRDLSERYQRDAKDLPQKTLATAVQTHGLAPWAIAAALGLGPALVLRRLAVWGEELDLGPLGLAACDASGTLVLRKPIDGFALPRFGAACPLLPLYTALGRPSMPVEDFVALPGQEETMFRAFAFAQPRPQSAADLAPLTDAVMLVAPQRGSIRGVDAPKPVGVSCQICPRPNCRGRREPSVLLTGG